MGADRIERGRRGIKPAGKKQKKGGPPAGEPWIWMTREMVSSIAFRSLSGNAMKVLYRVLEEHMAHGGTMNGQLLVTHKQFEAHGIRLASVAEAIREAEFFGFLSVDRGVAYKGGHEPNLYRLTWYNDLNNAPATNQWKGMNEQHVATWEIRRKAQTLKKANKPKKSVAAATNVVPIRA